MFIGWGVGELIQPGAGLNVNPQDLDPAAISNLAGKPAAVGVGWLSFIPVSLFDPFFHNDIIQLLLMAIFGGIALLAINEHVPVLNEFLDNATQWLFSIMRMITRLAPLAAFGAIGLQWASSGLVLCSRL